MLGCRVNDGSRLAHEDCLRRLGSAACRWDWTAQLMTRPPKAAARGDWMAWKAPLATEDDTGTKLLWNHNRDDFNAVQGAGKKWRH